MNLKKITITILITLISGVLLFLSSMTDQVFAPANTKYQVYLGGEKIGLIDNEDDLYQLIDESQTSIKEEYDVTNVYPPTDLKIIATNTFNSNSDSISDVYNKIEEVDDFTVLGYVITVKGEEHDYSLNVLDLEVFENATKRVVNAFLEADEYENYINNAQEEIVDTGRIIERMYFDEEIKVREAYISVNEKIYTDETELTQFLLFGSDPERDYYTVELGDTIASIADDNKLNVEEFLIANPTYKS